MELEQQAKNAFWPVSPCHYLIPQLFPPDEMSHYEGEPLYVLELNGENAESYPVSLPSAKREMAIIKPFLNTSVSLQSSPPLALLPTPPPLVQPLSPLWPSTVAVLRFMTHESGIAPAHCNIASTAERGIRNTGSCEFYATTYLQSE